VIGVSGSQSTVIFSAGKKGVRVYSVPAPGAVLEGFTIDGDYVYSSASIFCTSSELYCRDLRVEGEYGGAMYVSASGVEIAESWFESNVSLYGGAISIEGGSDVVITDSRFIGNNVYYNYQYGGLGGAIYLDGNSRLLADNVLFDGNSCHVGAGGAVFIGGGCVAALDGVSFLRNETTPGSGGAVYMAGDSLRISSSLFYGSQAMGDHQSSKGGAIYGESGVLEVNSSTIAFSAAHREGGALYIEPTCELTVDRAIIAFSQGDEAVYWQGSGAPPQFTCSDIFNVSGNEFGGDLADIIGFNGNFSEPPLFCAGDSWDEYSFELRGNSPCLPGANECQVLVGAFGEGCPPIAVAGYSALESGMLLSSYPN
ncbi:MAG: hypothetical protein HN344_10730, partial [Gammaproteobacteria bacterium]|nr:hypothetical protein [Gammaproteobacteria bacterium]